ncbi:MAG: peptide-methionine (S)-S-oxide reductase [bacterium]|nr:peptide-methionine (S)-S-oxide reductase [bacterium]
MRTRVGYSGGDKKNPTYYSLGDHTESIEIDYDPNKVSYTQLLELFWNMHNPVRPSYSQQYKSAVYFHDAEQEQAAREVKARIEKSLSAKLTTELLPLKKFYLAEDYHQKYYMRQYGSFSTAYEMLYPQLDDFINSTAVARINGFVGGSGDIKLLEEEIDDYGLDAYSQEALLNIAKNAHPIRCAY